LLFKCNNKVYIDEKLTAKQDGAIAQNVLCFCRKTDKNSGYFDAVSLLSLLRKQDGLRAPKE
jgi:hypothetical protein